MDHVVVTRAGDVATVALNNPQRLNALNRPTWARLGEVMRELSTDETLRCVVLRGAGDKAFAAGADIAEFATERADAKQAKAYGDLIHQTMQSVANCKHPTVAMIKGACVGGGLEIAMACDIRIAKREGGRVGLAEINLKTEFSAQGGTLFSDVGKCGDPVDRRLACAKSIQVRSVENQDGTHHLSLADTLVGGK